TKCPKPPEYPRDFRRFAQLLTQFARPHVYAAYISRRIALDRNQWHTQSELQTELLLDALGGYPATSRVTPTPGVRARPPPDMQTGGCRCLRPAVDTRRRAHSSPPAQNASPAPPQFLRRARHKAIPRARLFAGGVERASMRALFHKARSDIERV